MQHQIVIALMGPQGAGKTSFISQSLGAQASSQVCLGDTTTTISGTQVSLQGGKEVILVEVPALGNSSAVVTLSRFLTVMHRRCSFVGAIYFHRITDTREMKKDFKLFSQVLGTIPAKNTALITTMPNEDEESNIRREEELRGCCWNEAIARGASVGRFSNTSESAWNILDQMLAPESLDSSPIQKENLVLFLQGILARNKEESGIVKNLMKTAKAAKEDDELVEDHRKDSESLSSQKDDIKQLLRSLKEKHGLQLPFSLRR